MGKTKSKPKKPASESAATEAGTPAAASRVARVLAGLAADQPPLTQVQREAFAGRYADAACEALGTQTKSEAVLGDAVTWAPLMDKALRKHPNALRRYGRARFAWFLACAAALEAARAEQEDRGGAAAASKAAAAKAQAAALAARSELVETLEELADGNDDDEAALAQALGGTERPDRVVASLQSLAALGRRWLAREGAVHKELAAAAGLSAAEIEAAEAAAEALAAATAEVTMEGRLVTRDTPPVNRLEGRLLFEMKAAQRVFERANARTKEVPKLVPGAGTRHLLGRKSRAGHAAAEEPAKAPPATP